MAEADVHRSDRARGRAADRDSLRVGAIALLDPVDCPYDAVLRESIEARLGMPGPLWHAGVAEPVSLHGPQAARVLDRVADAQQQPIAWLATMLLDREDAGQTVAVAH